MSHTTLGSQPVISAADLQQLSLLLGHTQVTAYRTGDYIRPTITTVRPSLHPDWGIVQYRIEGDSCILRSVGPLANNDFSTSLGFAWLFKVLGTSEIFV